MNRDRMFLLVEAAAFGAASLLHAGVLARGFEHTKAMTAEAVIAAVLLAGLAATVLAPARRQTIALASQGFALAGTMVGLFTIAIGVGPQTAIDKLIHAGFLALLVGGLVAVGRRSAVPARV